jgi:uncharacterized membrane protein YesL
MNGLLSGVYKFSTWITRFAYLNALWMLFSLVGLIIFGFFPATTAMFSIVREWIKGNDEHPIFSNFIQNYKKEFIKSNLLGLILLIIGLILYVNMKFLFLHNTGFWIIINSISVMVTVVYLLMSLYIFPVFVHYDFSLIRIIQNAFLYMLANLKQTIIMVAASVTLYYGTMFFPGVSLVFGSSLYSFCLMYYANRAFNHVDQKRIHWKIEV